MNGRRVHELMTATKRFTVRDIVRNFVTAIAVIAILFVSVSCARAAAIEFAPAHFTIFKPGTNKVIGHAVYTITQDGHGYETVKGDYHYLNGQYDFEKTQIKVMPGDKLPILVHFEHIFYHANHTVQQYIKLDAPAGVGSCVQFHNGHPKVMTDHYKFPPDTYAGAAVMIPLQHFLRDGGHGTVTIHDFNCVPGPDLIEVRAYAGPRGEWSYYPKAVTEVNLEPYLGWYNFIVAPFLPRLHAWFAPSKNWLFVGGEFERYYDGQEILMALEPNAGKPRLALQSSRRPKM